MADDPFNEGPLDNRLDALINRIEVQLIYLIGLSPKVLVSEYDKFRENQINEMKVIIMVLKRIRNELTKGDNDGTD